MNFSGLQKTSLSDFPGRVAAVVFTLGCNFRCPYCHNPDLVLGGAEASITEDEVLDFLRLRHGRLGGLVVSGGEPTLHARLPDFLRRVRAAGLDIKLDTNGSRPEVIRGLIDEGLVDFVAMDVKAPLDRYREVVQSEVDPAALRASIDLIRASELDHEFRTTAVRPLVEPEDLVEIGSLLRGCQRYVLQPFVASELLDGSLRASAASFTATELDLLSVRISSAELCCQVR